MFNCRRNVLVNTLRLLIEGFITYLQSMPQEKGSNSAFSNIYDGVQEISLKSRTLSSNDDQSNESEKYVKNNFYAL